MSLTSKTIYYMKPFVGQLLDIWLQPIPFPTILKCLYSGLLMVIMFLPIIYPVTMIICYYGILQYIIESDLGILYPYNFDLIHYLDELFKYQIKNQDYVSFINHFVDRWRYVATALASIVDYIRLALSLIIG